MTGASCPEYCPVAQEIRDWVRDWQYMSDVEARELLMVAAEALEQQHAILKFVLTSGDCPEGHA